MAKVIIVRGIPGSGKSTYLKNVLGEEAQIFSADHYRFDSNGNYVYDPKQLRNAHWNCYKAYFETLREGAEGLCGPKDVGVDNTNIKAWELSPYIAVARLFGYDYQIVTLMVPPEQASNIHGAPPEAVARFWSKLQNEKLPNDWKQIIVKR